MSAKQTTTTTTTTTTTRTRKKKEKKSGRTVKDAYAAKVKKSKGRKVCPTCGRPL